MELAQRPSNELKDKTNINAVIERLTEATAEDFNELGFILENHANLIDALSNSDTYNPYYGRYESLILLQAAHTTAEANAWAIIDAGPGITEQVAKWNVLTDVWEITTATNDKVFVNNTASLPAPGTENTWYITLDKNELYLYYNAQYHLMNGSSAQTQTSNPLLLTVDSGFNITLATKPDNIDIWKNGFKLTNHATRDFEYNNTTGFITLYEEAAGELFEIRPYGSTLSTQQIIVASTAGQTVFNYSGNPASIDAIFEGFKMREGIDYTRTYFSTNNNLTLINTDLIAQVSIGTIITLRKF